MGWGLLVCRAILALLAAEDPPKAELVRLRFFVGLTNAEAAKVLGLSEPTVKRYWDFARAWLLREIRVLAAGTHSERGEPRMDANGRESG